MLPFEMITRLEEMDIRAMLNVIVSNNKQLLTVYNQFQLSAGRDSDGGYLPRYVDDPYFSSIEGALAYQEWKSGISTNEEKPEEVMDFRIRGDFHNSIQAEVMGENIKLYSHSDIAADVQEKTGKKALGINPQSAADYWESIIYPLLTQGIIEMLNK